MTETKKSGEFELSCGHKVRKSIDVEQRQKCPTCGKDTIVVRVLK